MTGYLFLDTFFLVTHIVIVTFTLSGWIFPKTRRIHLAVVLLTIFSWTVLGYFFGWGYCFWTDWHWQVREKLGKPHPGSFITLLVDAITGKHWDAALVDNCTEYVFYAVLFLSIMVNIRDYFRKKTAASIRPASG